MRYRTYEIPNLWATEPMRYRTYEIPNLQDTKPMRYRTYEILNLWGTKPIRYLPIRYRTLSNTEPIRYQTYQIPNLTDTEPNRYRNYKIPKLSDTCIEPFKYQTWYHSRPLLVRTLENQGRNRSIPLSNDRQPLQAQHPSPPLPSQLTMTANPTLPARSVAKIGDKKAHPSPLPAKFSI